MRSSAKRFFRKALKASHNQEPRVIAADKNAAYPKAIDELKIKKELPQTVELRQTKYVNNIASARPSRDKTISRSLVWDAGSFNTARAFVKGIRNYEYDEKGTNFLELSKARLLTESNS